MFDKIKAINKEAIEAHLVTILYVEVLRATRPMTKRVFWNRKLLLKLNATHCYCLLKPSQFM